MRIEEITKEDFGKKLRGYPKKELYNLRLRCIQIYKKHFEDNFKKETDDGIERADLLEKYRLVIHELRRRGLGYSTVTKLDRVIFKKAMTGLAVENMGEITLAENYLAISGAFLKDPKGADQIEVIIQDAEEAKNEDLEGQITEMIEKETGKTPVFSYNQDGPQSQFIPVFDLVLKNRGVTKRYEPDPDKKKKEQIEKPEVTETQIRIPVGPACDVTATLTISESKGIKALYCGGEKVIRTYLFDKEKWTMEQAKAWVKENHNKEETKKALSAAQQKEYDEETEQIRENAKTTIYPHDFKPAKFTHKNGHPRCIKCGQEETIKGICRKPKEKKASPEEREQARRQRLAWEAETKKIQASAPKAKYPHEFKEAKYPWPTGTKRCLVCGQAPPKDGDQCKKIPTKDLPEGWQTRTRKNLFKFDIVKVDKTEQIVGGIIYAPDEVDSQGDYTDASEIQKAMYKFMEKYQKDPKRIKLQHRGKTYSFPILEVFQPEEDTRKGNQVIKKGAWWLMVRVTNKAIWGQIEKGRITGFSLGGSAAEAKPQGA